MVRRLRGRAGRAGRADRAGKADRAARCDGRSSTGRFFQPIQTTNNGSI